MEYSWGDILKKINIKEKIIKFLRRKKIVEKEEIIKEEPKKENKVEIKPDSRLNLELDGGTDKAMKK